MCNGVKIATILFGIAGCGGWADAGEQRQNDGRSNQGLAANYPGDEGIADDPAVVFADDFESWRSPTEPPPGAWQVRRNRVSCTRTVPGRIVASGRGPDERVLEIACWAADGGSQTGGLSLKLGNYNHAGEGLGDGHAELFVRYYLKFDEEYRAVQNHGANLGGRDVARDNAAWVGMAGIRDVSSRGYFYSGVQPYGKLGGRELEMGFYSYHLDKRGPWGENYDVQKRIIIRPGEWRCVERRMKLNSVEPGRSDAAIADGVEELWIDGELAIRNPHLRLRRTENLKITFLSLETYYHGLPDEYTEDRPLKVYFDNLVIAKEYVGPLRSESP